MTGEGNGHPLQYSCLENPMDRVAWRATAHSVRKSQTRLKWLSRHAHWCWGRERNLGEKGSETVNFIQRHPHRNTQNKV